MRAEKWNEAMSYTVPMSELRAADLHCLRLLKPIFGEDSPTLERWYVSKLDDDLSMDDHLMAGGHKVFILKAALELLDEAGSPSSQGA